MNMSMMSVNIKTPTREQFEKVEFPCSQTQQSCQSILSASEVHNAPKTKIGKKENNEETRHGNLGDCTARSHSDSEEWCEVRQDLQGACHLQRKFSLGADDSSHCHAIAARKRRSSEKASGPSINALSGVRRKSSTTRGNFKEKISLPRKFLLGGNISDPLNLNSMSDEAVSKALNERTPHSSPLPTPARRQQVQLLIPPNINDPLNLNSGEDIDLNLISPKAGGRKKRNKHKNKKRSLSDGIELGESMVVEESFEYVENSEEADSKSEISESLQMPPNEAHAIHEVEDDVSSPVPTSLESKLKAIADKIVSHVGLKTSPKLRKRKRTSSDCRSSDASPTAAIAPRPAFGREDKNAKGERPSPHRKLRQNSSRSSRPQGNPPKFRQKDAKFIYGNYNRYYGYRNPETEEDHRMQCFKQEWFEDKDILDVGCNVGHVSLAIAKHYHPHSIVGMDIDGKLIASAKKNVRHYMSKQLTGSDQFPVSLPRTHGPIAAPSMMTDDKRTPDFPNNISFVQGNYVPEKEELLELQREEFDLILGLSLTKWIHLNWGDTGLKLAFKRMFHQLRPGGRLILEPQAWASYKKKKNITETVLHNFRTIKLRPEQFTEYLLSKEVGFGTCELIDTPFNKSKGFQRPILVFTKPVTAYSTPRLLGSRAITPIDTDSASATPNFEPCSCPMTPSVDSSIGGTPCFEIGSTGITPCSTCKNTPMYCMSAGATPRGESAGATPRGESAGATPRGESAGATPRGESAAATPRTEVGLTTPVGDVDANPRHQQCCLTHGSERSITPNSGSGTPGATTAGEPTQITTST